MNGVCFFAFSSSARIFRSTERAPGATRTTFRPAQPLQETWSGKRVVENDAGGRSPGGVGLINANLSDFSNVPNANLSDYATVDETSQK